MTYDKDVFHINDQVCISFDSLYCSTPVMSPYILERYLERSPECVERMDKGMKQDNMRISGSQFKNTSIL